MRAWILAAAPRCVDLGITIVRRSYCITPLPAPGAALAGLAWPVNLLQLGNSLSIWLSMSPWQLFFYVFLPPLLLDAAVRIDWYMFRKVRRFRGAVVWLG